MCPFEMVMVSEGMILEINLNPSPMNTAWIDRYFKNVDSTTTKGLIKGISFPRVIYWVGPLSSTCWGSGCCYLHSGRHYEHMMVIWVHNRAY